MEITKENYDEFLKFTDFRIDLRKSADKIAETLVQYVCRTKYGDMREVNFYPDFVFVSYEVTYCGCCSGDEESITFPSWYLFEENEEKFKADFNMKEMKKKELERLAKEEQKRKKIERKKLDDEAYKKSLEDKDKSEFLRLKKKYENS